MDASQSSDLSLNVTLVNYLLTNNDVTVTFQWPRETGAAYSVSILPETLLNVLINNSMTIRINLTVSYNIQYNVSIVSCLCGVTISKVLNYGKYRKL